jgi:hypothetical protein
MAWRTNSGRTSSDRPDRRGTDAAKGYVFRQDNAPAKRLVRETERHLRWESMSKQERSDAISNALWGDD